MATEPDMTAPVTRGELHEALEVWAGAIIEKVATRLDGVDRRFDAIDRRFDAFQSEMRALVATWERSIVDGIKAMLDPHRGVPERVTALEQLALPERVSKLEAKVFAPKRRATAARRKRS